MSAVKLSKIITGSGNLQIGGSTTVNAPTYAGTFLLNATQNKTAAGNVTIPPSAMTLDPTGLNVNASALLGNDTNNFTIKFPVSGIYSISYKTFANVTIGPIGGQFTGHFGTYLIGHTYNGVVLANPGVLPGANGFLATEIVPMSNPSSNPTTFGPRVTANLLRYFKAGDIIAPWNYCDSTSFKLMSDGATASSTTINVTLLQQMA